MNIFFSPVFSILYSVGGSGRLFTLSSNGVRIFALSTAELCMKGYIILIFVRKEESL